MATLLVFIGVNEDSIMVDDVATPLNPLVVPIEEGELEETPLNVDVYQ